MKNCAECKKRMVRNFLMCVLDIRSSELAEELNISKCHLSNMVAGRRNSKELNKIFCPDLSEFN